MGYEGPKLRCMQKIQENKLVSLFVAQIQEKPYLELVHPHAQKDP